MAQTGTGSQSDLGAHEDRDAEIEYKGLSVSSVVSQRDVRLAVPVRASGFHVTLGNRIGWVALTRRFPGESKKGFAGGRIDGSQIGDIGE